jgi:hypothetical protein
MSLPSPVPGRRQILIFSKCRIPRTAARALAAVSPEEDTLAKIKI